MQRAGFSRHCSNSTVQAQRLRSIRAAGRRRPRAGSSTPHTALPLITKARCAPRPLKWRPPAAEPRLPPLPIGRRPDFFPPLRLSGLGCFGGSCLSRSTELSWKGGALLLLSYTAACPPCCAALPGRAERRCRAWHGGFGPLRLSAACGKAGPGGLRPAAGRSGSGGGGEVEGRLWGRGPGLAAVL